MEPEKPDKPEVRTGAGVTVADAPPSVKENIKEELELLKKKSAKESVLQEIEDLKDPTKSQIYKSMFRVKHEPTPRSRSPPSTTTPFMTEAIRTSRSSAAGARTSTDSAASAHETTSITAPLRRPRALRKRPPRLLSERARERIQPTLVGWTSVPDPDDYFNFEQGWNRGALAWETGTGATALLPLAARAETTRRVGLLL